MRVLAIAVLGSALLAIAGPRARSAISALRSEAATQDAMATSRSAPQRVAPTRWVRVVDQTRALAQDQARRGFGSLVAMRLQPPNSCDDPDAISPTVCGG